MKEIAAWLRELFSPIKMFAMNHITVKSVKSMLVSGSGFRVQGYKVENLSPLNL